MQVNYSNLYLCILCSTVQFICVSVHLQLSTVKYQIQSTTVQLYNFKICQQWKTILAINSVMSKSISKLAKFKCCSLQTTKIVSNKFKRSNIPTVKVNLTINETSYAKI